MTGLGIYNYGARFYSAKLGRFLSADTIVPNPYNPQDLNRFSYVRNNPLRYTDPTGNRPCGDGEVINCDGTINNPTPPVLGSGCGGAGQQSCGGGELNTGGGGGGKPQSNPNLNNDACSEYPDYSVCVDLSSDFVDSYWTINNNYLDDMGNFSIWASVGGFVSGAAGLYAYLTTAGQQDSFFTPNSIALFASLALLTPTTLGAVLIGAGLGLAAGAIIISVANNNLQQINNAIVDSGALENGGTIVAGPTEVNIITSEGTTTVPSLFVGEFTLWVWAELHLE